MNIHAHQSGLTLPEMLISVAILASVMAVLSPMIRNAAKTSFAMETQAAMLEELRSSTDILQHLSATAITPDKNIKEVKTEGSATFVVFGSYDPSGRPSMVMLDSDTDAKGIAITITPINGDETHTSKIYKNISDIQFQFYGSATQRNTAAWHNSWTGPKPPILMRLTGRNNFANSTQNYSIDFVFGGQTPLICEFDPVSRICRNAV